MWYDFQRLSWVALQNKPHQSSERDNLWFGALSQDLNVRSKNIANLLIGLMRITGIAALKRMERWAGGTAFLITPSGRDSQLLVTNWSKIKVDFWIPIVIKLPTKWARAHFFVALTLLPYNFPQRIFQVVWPGQSKRHNRESGVLREPGTCGHRV